MTPSRENLLASLLKMNLTAMVFWPLTCPRSGRGQRMSCGVLAAIHFSDIMSIDHGRKQMSDATEVELTQSVSS